MEMKSNINRYKSGKYPLADATSRNIVQDRLMEEYFYIPTGAAKDGKVKKEKIVSNLFLNRLNKEEKKYRDNLVAKKKYVPNYITISTESPGRNIMGYTLHLNTLTKSKLFKNTGEINDDVVTPTSVQLPEVMFDKTVLYGEKKVIHSDQMKQTELLKKYYLHPFTANEKGEGDDSLIVLLGDYTLNEFNFDSLDGNPAIVKYHPDMVGDNIEFLLRTNANSKNKMLIAKLNQDNTWKNFMLYDLTSNVNNKSGKKFKLKFENEKDQYLIALMDSGNKKSINDFNLTGYDKSKLNEQLNQEFELDSFEEKQYPYQITPLNLKQDRNIIKLQFKINDIYGNNVGSFNHFNDFIIKDNNQLITRMTKPKVSIKEIKKGVNMTLALDYSNSMQEDNALVKSKNAAEQYILNLKGSKEVNVFAFTDVPTEIQSFTKDYQKASRSVFTYPPGGGTAVFDTVVETSKILGKQKGNKPLILMSDGEDTDSKHSLEDALKYAKDNNVTIYTVALGGNIQSNILQRLSSETGGQYYQTGIPTELDDIYNDITTSKQYVYEITYIAPEEDENFDERNVFIQLTNKKSNVGEITYQDERISNSQSESQEN